MTCKITFRLVRCDSIDIKYIRYVHIYTCNRASDVHVYNYSGPQLRYIPGYVCVCVCVYLQRHHLVCVCVRVRVCACAHSRYKTTK